MEDITANQANTRRDSNKSIGRLTGGTPSSTTAQISSSNCSGSKTLIVYGNDESVEIKEKIIEERYQGGEHNLLEKNQLAGKSISSDNKSAAKTSIVYENDESVEIKEEIIEDQERHQGGEHNLLSEKNQLDEKSISSDIKSAVKTSIVYENDETLEIKEEIIQDQETVSSQTLSKKYESILNTVDTRKSDILAADILRINKKTKIQDPKPEPSKKYKCQKCSRSYKHKYSLNAHQKFECGVTPQKKEKSILSRQLRQVHQKKKSNQKKQKMREIKQVPEKKHAAVKPQFICDICDYTTTVKHKLSSHISLRHFKNSNLSQARHTCCKCSLSYSSLGALREHDSSKHAAVKPQFFCDVCDYKTCKKSHLTRHISSRHSKNSRITQVMHSCDKCSLNYSSLDILKRHNRLKHGAVKPQFTCDVCGFKTNVKSSLSTHTNLHHKTSQARYNCEKCSLNYSSLAALKRHNRLKHAADKPLFICDFCGYETNLKSCLSSHVISRHLKKSKTSQARYNCDKCFRSYSRLSNLKKHDRLKHATAKPQFVCNV